MSDIFISYSSEDRDRILPLVKALGKTGWSVFWDRNIPQGKTWRRVIGSEILACRSLLARIIHGFWKSCEELASLAKRFQSDCQMLKFVQAVTTGVADLVIEGGKNAFLENTPALVCCDFLDSGRLFFASGA
jgi:TIR domain